MSVFSAVGNYFKNLGLSLVGQLQASVAAFLTNFVKDDIGKLAVDSVEYAATFADKSGAEKQAIAKAKLLDDLKAAGHDATVFGESVLNFLIEAAYQALLAAASQGILAI